MRAPAKVALIVNPAAGGGRAGAIADATRAALDTAGVEHRSVVTEDVEHGCAAARSAARDGELVAVISGDGLLGQIAGALAQTEGTLAVVPAGRGNDFARVAGIPTEPAAAIALLRTGTVREVDVGEVNGRRFLCIASCGFDSESNRIANETRVVRGNLVYLYAALRALAAWRPARFELELDGRRREFRGYSVVVANSKAYGGGMLVAPGAELDDGLLDVVSIGEVGKLRFLANLPKVFRGAHLANPEVSVERAASVRVSADRPFAVYADGDRIADLPATVRVLPRALRVVVPA